MKSPFVLVMLLCALFVAGRARAADEDEAFARVIVAETELRSGPGVSHRVILRARRGESFAIEQRETSAFWLQVLLPDGRTAYVLGDTVEAVSASEETADAPGRPGLFAPPALQEARGGFALLGGAYDLDGYGELRPALVLAPAIALEPYIGIALEPDSRRLVYGLAGTLNLAPDWAIAPYVTLGAGGVHENPKDEFVERERSWFHLRAGGGLLISLRLRILVRLEATNFALFTEDDYENVQSYIGGLGTYFESAEVMAMKFLEKLALSALGPALLGLCGAGCATVRPEQRAVLADPVMQYQDETGDREARDHVLENREASYGGSSVKGGGCGCN